MQPPLAIVWRCALGVAEYAAAGKKIEFPEVECPACAVTLRPWSWYERDVREIAKRVIWVRRGRCPKCKATQALLPDFVHARRLDVVEVLGAEIELAAAKVGTWKASERLGLPFSTVRDRRLRCRQQAQWMLQRLAVLALQLGVALAELSTRPTAALVSVLWAVWERSRERLPAETGGLWRFWNAVCSGRALGRNTSPA